MAWVVSRRDHDGSLRFQVRFRDANGTTRTAGTYASRREALKAGRRVDGWVEDGTWISPAAGRVTFRDYVEETWWPSRHLEVSTRAAYRSYLDRHFIPFFGHRAMSSITVDGAGMGDEGIHGGALTAQPHQVPRHAARHLQASRPRPGHPAQP